MDERLVKIALSKGCARLGECVCMSEWVGVCAYMNVLDCGHR